MAISGPGGVAMHGTPPWESVGATNSDADNAGGLMRRSSDGRFVSDPRDGRLRSPGTAGRSGEGWDLMARCAGTIAMIR